MKQNYEVPLVETVIIRNKETICEMSGGQYSAETNAALLSFDDDSD